MHHAHETPAYLTSRFTLQVRFCETDLMGIVHHANYLTYFEAGRVDWLHRRGINYDLWVKQGIHLPVVETRLRYRKAARFDDVLVVETTCAALTRVTVRFDYRILRGGELLCEGETLLACVGDNLAPRRLPAAMTEVFRSPEREPPHQGHHHKAQAHDKAHEHAHHEGPAHDKSHRQDGAHAHTHDKAHEHAHHEGHGHDKSHRQDGAHTHTHDKAHEHAHDKGHGHDEHSSQARRSDSR